MIPSALRRKYGIRPGTRVELVDEGEEIVLHPITTEFIRRMRGAFRSPTSATQELLKDRERDEQALEAKLARFPTKRRPR